MFTSGLNREIGIDIDNPRVDISSGIVGRDPFDLWSVCIGDRAIGQDEEQDGRLLIWRRSQGSNSPFNIRSFESTDCGFGKCGTRQSESTGGDLQSSHDHDGVIRMPKIPSSDQEARQIDQILIT